VLNDNLCSIPREFNVPPSHQATLPLRQYEDLPGPSGIPIFGNALQIKPERMHLQLEQWCEEFGPYFKLKLGKRQILVVGDHTIVGGLLRDRPDGFSRTTRLDEIWSEMGLQNGVFGANGDRWKAQRRMVMAAFDPAHVRNYFPALQRVSHRLAGRWLKATNATTGGTAIDLQADLMRYTVDTIAGLAFGADVNTLESDEDVIQQHLDKIFPAVFGRLFAPIPVWRYRKSKADKALDVSVAALNIAIEGFITQARLALKTPRCAITPPICWKLCWLPPTNPPAALMTTKWLAMCSPCYWRGKTPPPTPSRG
jgi:cytochrome P450